MVLVDTSVWINHLRIGNKRLAYLLHEGKVCCHPFIIGELACGNLKNRSEVLTLLQNLPQVLSVHHPEILLFINNYTLMGTGIGYIDVSLLASAKLSDANLWTFDRKLDSIASSLHVNYIIS